MENVGEKKSMKTSLNICIYKDFLFFFLKDKFYPDLTLCILFIWTHSSCLQTHQKRASDTVTDGCEPPCGCWELNSGPLEEQTAFLITGLPLQPSLFLFVHIYVCLHKFLCHLHAHTWQGQKRPGAGVTGSRELPAMGAKNWSGSGSGHPRE